MSLATRSKWGSLCLLVIAAPCVAQPQSPWGAPIGDFGGAELLKSDWFTFRDYPQEAIGGRQQGRVVVSFDITVEGRAKNCMVKESGGHRSLDRAPCRPLERKARFRPAAAEDGTPKASQGELSVDFWMPPPPRN
jgi:TonB family protein